MTACENCGKPATVWRMTGRGEVPTCDRCIPGDGTGEMRPVGEAADRVAISKEEAAERLGIGLSTFDRHVVGKLKNVRQVGGRVLVPVSELDAFMEGKR